MRRSNRRYSFPGPLSYGHGSVTAILLAAGWLLFSGYVINTDRQLQHPRWLTSPIKLEVWSGFSDLLSNIEDGSRPKLALRAAMERWTRVSGVSVLYAETDEQNAGEDSRNIVTIADTQAHKDLVGQALAVTVTLSTSGTGGKILDADVVFNPALDWSTVEPDSRTTDREDFPINLLDVAQHEFGHVWNLDHTISRGAAMYPGGGSFGFDFNELSWDDLAGINTTPEYQMLGLDRITGTISGQVTLNGNDVFGAFVSAVDEYGQLAASTISLPDGSYQLKFLPPGRYTLYVEPLDGPILPEHLSGGVFDSLTAADFLPRFYLDSAEPRVGVNAGEPTTGISFQVSAGSSSVDPRFIATIPDPFSSNFFASSSRAEVSQEESTHFVIAGRGADRIADEGDGLFFLKDHSDVNLLGAVTHFHISDSVSQSDPIDEEPFKIFPMEISAATPEGDYSAFLRADSSGELGVISGALRVHSPWRFLQAFGQFAHFPGPPSVSSEVFLVNINLSPDAVARGSLSARDGLGVETQLDLDPLAPGDGFDLAPGGSLKARTRGDAFFLGSLRARADQQIGGTVLFESSQGTTGVSAGRPLYSFVAPFEVRDGGKVNTGFAIANLDARPVDIYVQAQNQAGQTVENGTAVLRIEGNGQLSLFVSDPSGGPHSLIPNLPPDFKGTISVTANRKIAATVIRTSASPDILTTFPVIQNRVRGQSFFAQFAHNDALDLSSELLLLNPSRYHTAANVLVQFRDISGQPAAVLLDDGDILATGQKTVSIPPLGSVSLRTGSDLAGSVEVSSNIPVGGVVLFRSASAGTTGVGESLAQNKAVLPVSRNRDDEIEMGIAVVNTEDHEITLTVSARDQDGMIVAGPRTIRLGAREQLAGSPNDDQLALGLPDSFTGSLWLEASGDSRFAATVIRFSPGVLTTFPAISLEQFVGAAPRVPFG
ncbi:MAG: matrixin family metalloprotease [Acidobacteriota bacterium]